MGLSPQDALTVNGTYLICDMGNKAKEYDHASRKCVIIRSPKDSISEIKRTIDVVYLGDKSC